MLTEVDSQDLESVSGGDSFWKDLGQFIGGFIAGVQNVPDPVATAPLSGAVVAGIVAAAVN